MSASAASASRSRRPNRSKAEPAGHAGAWPSKCGISSAPYCGLREAANNARAHLGIGGIHGDSNRIDRHVRLVLESLVPARSRLDRHDGDLQSAIRLDAVYRAAQPEARNDARRIAVDVLAADHSADLVLAAAGLSGRPLRPAPADFGRRADVGRRLGAVGLCRQYLGALLHLRRSSAASAPASSMSASSV